MKPMRFAENRVLQVVLALAVHAVGAHYTYAKVPAGFWLADWMHLSRNHYDRVIHFAFGFLLLYPMRELMMGRIGANGKWANCWRWRLSRR